MRTMYIDRTSHAIIDVSAQPPGAVGDYEINRINVPAVHRGQGIARQLMSEVLADADQEGASVHLYVNPYGNLDWDALTAWYHRLGFLPHLPKDDELHSGSLLRQPAQI